MQNYYISEAFIKQKAKMIRRETDDLLNGF